MKLHLMPRDRLRLGTLLLAVALCAAQVLASAHELLVPHRVCAEHGELVEGVAASAPASEAPSGPLARSIEDQAGEHEHCPLVLLAKERAQAESTGVRISRDDQVAPLRALVEPRAPAVALHFLAPKQSPPL